MYVVFPTLEFFLTCFCWNFLSFVTFLVLLAESVFMTQM